MPERHIRLYAKDEEEADRMELALLFMNVLMNAYEAVGYRTEWHDAKHRRL